MGLWERLLAIETPGNTALKGVDLGLRAPWALAAALAVAALAALVVLYFSLREAKHVGVPRRLVLGVIRVGAVSFLAFLVFRPVSCTAVLEGHRPRSVVLLVDNSQSLTIQDKRLSTRDKLRTAIALGQVPLDSRIEGPEAPTTLPTGLPDSPRRVDLVRGVLNHPDIKLEESLAKVGPLRTYLFGSGLRRLPAGTDAPSLAQALTVADQETRLADAVDEVLAKGDGDPPAAVVLITDGADNASKTDLATVARKCEAAGVPLHIYGVGSTEAGTLQWREVSVPDVVFAQDLVSVPVRWRAHGIREGTVEVVLAVNGQEVARHEEKVREGDDLRAALQFKPPELKAGERPVLTASVRVKGSGAYSDELVKPFQIVDKKVKVLYVEGMPRWVYKHLQTALVRDRRVEANFYLTQVDEGARERTPPYLSEFPATKKDLFAYDLIIVGDVPAAFFNGERGKMLEEFVKEGGGMVHIAGRVHAPASWAGTPLADLLPVEFEAKRFPRLSDVRTEGFHPVLTRLGELNDMMALADTREDNLQAWRNLPAMHWFYPVKKLKPAAVALLTHPTEKAGDEPMPLLAVHSVGRGQVLFMGVEETWRWLFNKQDDRDYFARFWGQVVYRIGLSRDIGPKQTQLGLDRPDPVVGRTTTIYARLFDSEFQPVKEKSVTATLEQQDGPVESRLTQKVELLPVAGQEGLYQATIAHDRVGRFALTVPGTQKAELDFRVTLPPKHELAVTTLVAEPLIDAAAVSGGSFYREEDLHKLTGAIKAQQASFQVKQQVLPWNWLALLAFVGIVTLEWVVRKFSNLS